MRLSPSNTLGGSIVSAANCRILTETGSSDLSLNQRRLLTLASDIVSTEKSAGIPTTLPTRP